MSLPFRDIKFTLRNKILITFLGTLLIGILIMISVNSFIITNFSRTSADTTFEAMKIEELEGLDRLAQDRSLLVNEYFSAIITDVRTMFNYAEELFNGRLNVTPRTTYWADINIDSSSPPIDVTDYFGFGPASWQYSTIYLPGVNTNSEFANLGLSTQDMINQSSGLDYVFRAIHTSNDNYIWIYMGFEEAGLFRQLPFNDMAWARDMNEDGNFGSNLADYYDPRQESWYTSAVSADDLNIFLDKDPESGLIVTISKAVYYDNGDLVGVISVDLPIDVVENAVAGDSILENGYAFMVDNFERALIHPRLVTDASLFGSDVVDLEFTSEIEKSDFNLILNEITTTENGQFEFIKDKDTWYVSFARVKAGDFSILVVVPESDIIAPALEIRKEIRQTLFTRILVFLLLTLILTFAIVFFASLASKQVVEPIKELTQVTELIAKGNLSKSLTADYQSSREVNLLYDTFKGLITTLRFGNEDYYAGDINRAMTNYQNALELFTNLKNQTGVGICYNNIGNIHRARGNLKDANEFYRKAIDIGKELLEKSPTEERIQHVIGLSSRYNNIGLLYKEIEQFEKAEEYIHEALRYDREIDNARGFATRYGNLGLIYLAQQRFDDAKNAFDEAKDIAESLDSNRARAYSKMNYGLLERERGNVDDAIELFLDAVELAEDLDVRIITTSLKNVQELYEEEGKTDLAGEIGAQLQTASAVSRPKEVTFVLDYSGSMSGRRIRAAISGMVNIFKNQINGPDTVSIITFDSRSRILISPRLKDGNEKTFMLTFDELHRPSGATAMYDALGAALYDFNIRPTKYEQWVIALTDGDDNSSRIYNPNSVEIEAKNAVGVNLVIIGVGNLRDQAVLERICNSTDKGKFIHVSHGVSDAITTAFEEVSSMLAEVEVEGFIPDF